MDAILRANVKRGAQVMVATHNERSVRFAVEKMHEYGIPRQRGGVYFGQLLGSPSLSCKPRTQHTAHT